MDQGKLINAYIDELLGNIKDLSATTALSKAKARLSEDIVIEQSKTIEKLTTTLQQIDVEGVERSRLRAKEFEDAYHALNNKVSHMDTLIQELTAARKKIAELEKEIENYRTPKKTPSKKRLLVEEDSKAQDF